ncbi:MAG: threonine synthase, partial [Deltaproteobacteria bacterium]
EYARRMGLPVRSILMPVNENNEFSVFLQSGIYKKISPSIACLSNAMNVGNPSNLSRFFELYGGTIDRNGIVHQQPQIEELRKKVFSVSVSDEETRHTIKRIYTRYGVVLEPHGAVAWQGLETYLEQNGDFPLCVSLETAHPAKFPEEVERLLGIKLKLPISMKGLEDRTGEPITMSANYEEFKCYLKDTLPSIG